MRKFDIKSFELPYNFDNTLIQKYKILDEFININSIYIPTYIEDYACSRGNNYKDKNNMPIMTREMYERNIFEINKYFNGRLMLLVQNPDFGLSEERLRYYHDTFNINKFCVSNLEFAKLVRKIYPDSTIVCSIVRRPEEAEFNDPEYTSVFDEFVLWFPFIKDLDRISKLPKLKYVLLVNSRCSIKCPGINHWRAGFEGKTLIEAGGICDRDRPDFDAEKESTYLRPEKLPLYDDYIYSYKIQGRDWPSDTVFGDIMDIIKYYPKAKKELLDKEG